MARIICVCIVLLSSYFSYSQGKEARWPHTPIPLAAITGEMVDKLPNYTADLQASYPFGKTGENLSIGVTARVGYTNNPFGFIPRSLLDDSSGQRAPGVNQIPEDALKSIDLLTRRVGWNAGASYTYLPGKKEDFGSITYKYDPMSIVHVYGGVNYDVCPSGDIELDLGPAMAFFGGGGSEFGFGATLDGFWSFRSATKQLVIIKDTKQRPPVFGVSGGLSFYKFKEVDPLYTVNLGVRMTF
jgi:hypothetical protein